MSRKSKGWAQSFTSLFIEVEPGASAEPEVDIEALLRESSPAPRESAPEADSGRRAAPASARGTSGPPSPPPPPAAAPVSELVLGQPLAEIYRAYEVPPTPKTIEEIMLFLAGLRGMPESVQLTALKAMDDADPNWSITDVVVDGRYKADALARAKAGVDGQLEAARKKSAAELGEQESYLDGARKTIREQIEALHTQIADLQGLLAAEEAQVDQRKAAAREHIASVEAAARQEHIRLETEIARITQVVAAFGPLSQEP